MVNVSKKRFDANEGFAMDRTGSKASASEVASKEDGDERSVTSLFSLSGSNDSMDKARVLATLAKVSKLKEKKKKAAAIATNEGQKEISDDQRVVSQEVVGSKKVVRLDVPTSGDVPIVSLSAHIASDVAVKSPKVRKSKQTKRKESESETQSARSLDYASEESRSLASEESTKSVTKRKLKLTLKSKGGDGPMPGANESTYSAIKDRDETNEAKTGSTIASPLPSDENDWKQGSVIAGSTSNTTEVLGVALNSPASCQPKHATDFTQLPPNTPSTATANFNNNSEHVREIVMKALAAKMIQQRKLKPAERKKRPKSLDSAEVTALLDSSQKAEATGVKDSQALIKPKKKRSLSLNDLASITDPIPPTSTEMVKAKSMDDSSESGSAFRHRYSRSLPTMPRIHRRHSVSLSSTSSSPTSPERKSRAKAWLSNLFHK